jgi:hypothetical protein
MILINVSVLLSPVLRGEFICPCTCESSFLALYGIRGMPALG